MMDLGKDWILVLGAPALKNSTTDVTTGRKSQKIAGKTIDKCAICIEGPQVVVSDEKGKKVHASFDLHAVKTIDVKKLSYYGFVRFHGYLQLTQFCAVVMLGDGKIYSLVDKQDATGFRLKSLANTLGYKQPDGASPLVRAISSAADAIVKGVQGVQGVQGGQQPKVAPAGPWTCSKCGTQNAAGTKFCGQCGAGRA